MEGQGYFLVIIVLLSLIYGRTLPDPTPEQVSFITSKLDYFFNFASSHIYLFLFPVILVFVLYLIRVLRNDSF